jgi:hypothetical protein
VQVSVALAPHQSRVLAGFSIPFFLARMLLAIPVVIVLYFVGIALGVVAWIGQWAILFTGHYPDGMHDFCTGVVRWQTRLSAWMYGLTDSYPGFGWAP